MSKLEEKLKELGYKQSQVKPTLYYKTIHNYIDIYIYVEKNEIINHGVNREFLIKYAKEITFIKEAFNQMQKDLEILKEKEKNEKDN